MGWKQQGSIRAISQRQQRSSAEAALKMHHDGEVPLLRLTLTSDPNRANRYRSMMEADFRQSAGVSTGQRGPLQVSLLCAQGERCTGDGGGQVQSLCDFPPDLLVDDLHQAPLVRHQLVEHVQIQDLLGHDGDTIDRGPWRRHGNVKNKINLISHEAAESPACFSWISSVANVQLLSAL